jgi:hypothetical protein
VVVAFRAFVMLAFLIAVPAVALLGTSLPDTLRQLAERHLGISFNVASASPAPTAPEAPLFAAQGNPGVSPADGSANGTVFAPPEVTIPTANAGPPANLAALGTASPVPLAGNLVQPAVLPPSGPVAMPVTPAMGGMSSARPDPAVVPAGYNASVNPLAAVPGVQMVAGQPLAQNPSAAPGDAWAGRSMPTDRGTQPVFAAPPPGGPTLGSGAAETGNQGESLPRIQQRLRELGSTYSLLESWGNQGQLYRFYCKMAIGGNANYTRYFEATDSDPVRVMNRVLQQVEAWRAGQL